MGTNAHWLATASSRAWMATGIDVGIYLLRRGSADGVNTPNSSA